MSLHSTSLVAFLLAVSFAAGLNVYATVAVLGLLARTGWFALPAGLRGLAETWVIAAAAAMFCVEFFADKIPLFDVVWNALHTLVRLRVAALMAYSASRHLSPEMQALVTMLGAAVAAVAHGSKTAARVAVSPSPEPVSNAALSGLEDVVAVGLTRVATRHPYVAGGAAAVALIAAGLLVQVIVRGVRRQVALVRRKFRGENTTVLLRDA